MLAHNYVIILEKLSIHHFAGNRLKKIFFLARASTEVGLLTSAL